MSIAIAVLTTGCSDELSRQRAQAIFDYDSGFVLPGNATNVFGIIGSSDFHGDYSVALTFTVPPDEVRAFRALNDAGWTRPGDLKAVSATTDLLGGDTTLRSDSIFRIPAGTLLIEQRGPGDKIRRYAIDEAARRVYYYRCTW